MNKTTSLYKSHKTIYTDPVSGYFSSLRFYAMTFLFLSYFLIPWINWNNRQAFLFDISTVRFYFFNFIFWLEDFYLLALFFIISVLILFAVTVYAGRIWCGFLCPQSIWIRVSMFFSRFVEGKRNARKKLDEEINSLNYYTKKFIKHIILISFSFLTAFTFVGYFVPVNLLYFKLVKFNFYNWSFFWILFFSFLTYFNIAWFKEQFCFLVCPYARLQSVMFDENTLIVAYDFRRGEKRGSRKKGVDYQKLGLGDCIDCRKCVTCCPTGIDIRDGLQMECIGCAACIDACNAVMRKMSYKTNLICYIREIELTSYVKKFNKFRLIVYFFAILFFIFVLCYGVTSRNVIQFNINRSQLQLYTISSSNFIENVYFLKITNKTTKEAIYSISINNKDFEYIGLNNVLVNAEDTVLLDVKLLFMNKNYSSKFVDVFFTARDINNPNIFLTKKSKFVIPFYAK